MGVVLFEVLDRRLPAGRPGVRIYEDLRGRAGAPGRGADGGGGRSSASWPSPSGTCRWCAARYFKDLAENNRTRVGDPRRPAGTAARPQGPRAGGEPSFLQRGADSRAQPRPGRDGGAGGAGPPAGRSADPRAAGPTVGTLPAGGAADGCALEDVAAVEARRLELPEVSVEVVPLRSYPLASAAAHTLGRVGEVSERQLQQAEFAGLEPGALVGQAGLESQYNRSLMGKDGRAAGDREQPRAGGGGGRAGGARGRSCR